MDSGALDGGSDTPGIADAGGDAAFAVRAIQCGEQQDGSGSEPLGSGEAWYARIRGPESQVSHTFAIDTEGSILVAGSSRDAVDFGESLASDAGQSPSVDGIFIAKYTKQGELTWVKQYAATQPIITSIVTDGTDIALVGQYTTSALQIGGTVLPEPKPIETRVFVARFDAEGTPLFAQSLTPAGLEIAGLVTVLQDHSLLVARYAGEGDIWLTKLAQDGAIVDDRAVARVPDDGTSMPPFSDLAVDSDGNVFLTGFFAGTANFGAGPVHATTDPDLPPIINRGIFVAKYAATDGSLIWEQHYGASSSDSTAGGYSLLPIDDDVVVAGAFEYGHTNLGSGNLEEAECPRLLATDPLDGESDGTFVARLSGASGELQWSIVLPSGRSFGAKLTRDPVGDIALLAIVRNADATSFAEVYSASTGAFVRGRILPELGGGVTSANGRMTLDADGQVVTATAFWGSLGGFESEGYEDILVARFPL